MTYYILIGVAGFSAFALLLLFAWQIMKNRRNSEIDFSQVEHYSLTDLIVDFVAFKIVQVCKGSFHFVYFWSLVLFKKFLSLSKFFIIRIEKRFAKIVEATSDRRIVHRNGPVSFFLKEIKEHKESLVSAPVETEERTTSFA